MERLTGETVREEIRASWVPWTLQSASTTPVAGSADIRAVPAG